MFFISYARSEHALMKHYILTPLMEIQAPFWYDEQISSGKFNKIINKEIDSSMCFTFLFSKAWQESSICQEEYNLAKKLGKHLIPVRCSKFQESSELMSLSPTHHIIDVYEEEGTNALLKAYSDFQENHVVASKSKVDDNVELLSEYCKRIEKESEEIRILGNRDKLRIEDIFLHLKIREARFHAEEEHFVKYLLDCPSHKVLIVGGPGTGKTTTLQYLQFESARNQCLYFPVYKKFRELVSIGQPFQVWVDEYLRGQLSRKISFFANPASPASPKLLLLLDGFDEIPDSEAERLSKEILQFCIRYPKVKIICTSRPNEYRQNLLAELSQFEIQPLREPEIRSYIERVVPEKSVGKIWRTIKGHSRIFELATTPFLLALIAASNDHITPRASQRANLFKTCIRYLLKYEDYDAGRNNRDTRELDKLFKLLSTIAVRFFKLDYVDNFSHEEVLHNISLVPGYKTEAENVLNEIVEKTGLLQFDRDGYQFVHRSIWEYLVAEGVKHEPLSILVDRANSVQWEEPIRLHVGLASSNDLNKVLSELWERNPTLALRSMTETEKFPDRILESLYSLSSLPEKIRILEELRLSVKRAATQKEKNRILIDTVAAIIKVEKNCEILYHLITFLREANSSEANDLIAKILDYANLNERIIKYIADDDFCFKFSKIDSSEFEIGLDWLPDGEDSDASERPAHVVSVDSFWMCKYLVTNKLYYDEFPYSVDNRDDYSREERQPVHTVNWYEATIFAWWLGCELPTNAEWEIAARSCGLDDLILTDHKKLPDFAWYGDNSKNRTHKVGTKKPNSNGLYDVAGNLREWCEDWYDKDYYAKCRSLGTVHNPKGAEEGKKKILRGGTFDWALTNLRPTYRNSNTPDNGSYVTGFRLVIRDQEISKCFDGYKG